MIVYRSNTIKALDGSQYRIDIDDVHYNNSSGILAFRLAGEGFNLKYEGNGNGIYDGAIRASSIDVLIEVNPASDGWSTGIDTWLNNIIYADEQRYTILLYKYISSAWTLDGVYPVLQDLATFEDAFPFTFTLCGTDGLGRLKDIDFNPNSLIQVDGKARIGDVLRLALSNTGVDLFYPGYSSPVPYIQSSINWYELTQETTNDVLVDARIPIMCLFDDAVKLTYKNCYDIIKAMLQPFGANLKMSNGTWWISQPDNYTNTTFDVNVYYNRPFSNGKASRYTFTPKLTEDTTGNTNFRRLAGGSMIMKPAMQYAHVNYKSTSRYLFSKPNYDTYNLADTTITCPNLYTYATKLQIHLTYQVLQILTANSTYQSGFARFEFQIKVTNNVGSVWFITMNPSDENTTRWTDSPVGYHTIWYDIPKVTDSRLSDIIDFDLVIPAVPDTTITSLEFVFATVHEIDSTCGSALKWSANFELSQLNANGDDFNEQQYQATNSSFPAPMPCDSCDVTTNFITLSAHGFSNGQQLRIVDIGTTTLLQNSLLFVVNKTTNTFQLSLTSGGSVYALGGTSTLAPTVQKYDSATQRLASVKQEFDLLIGDNAYAFSDSAIEVYTGSIWQRSTTWNVGTSATTGYELGQLLAIKCLLMQKTPRMCYQGNLKYGTNLFPSNTIYMFGKLFMFNSSTYAANGSSSQIEYIECALSSDDSSIGTGSYPHHPVIDKLKDLLNQVKNLNNTVGGIQGAVSGLQSQVYDLNVSNGNKQPLICNYLPNLPTSPSSGQQVSVDAQFNDALGIWELTAHH